MESPKVIDALGNEVVIGAWYGYSALGGGYSHTTIGKIKYVNEITGKVRLENCIVKDYLYGTSAILSWKENKKPSDVSIRASMIFPIPSQD